MKTTLSSTLLDISYRSFEHVLVARWMQAMHTVDDFQISYFHLLEMAALHNCPFWLLDVRRCQPNCAKHARWLLYEFCPHITPALRATTPVFGSYLVNPPHLVHYEDELLPVLANEMNTCYQAAAFIDEGPTNAWLFHQQPMR